MGVLRDSLIVCPIYRHSKSEYYQERKRWIIKQKKYLEEKCGSKFENLSTELQFSFENSWFWPYWRFNDIVGFLNIGMDGSDSMTGDIYLKHKWLPRSDKHNLLLFSYGAAHLEVKQRQALLYFREIDKIKVDLSSEGSFQKAMNQIIDRAQECLNKMPKKFIIGSFLPGLSCVNLKQAYVQSKNAPDR